MPAIAVRRFALYMMWWVAAGLCVASSVAHAQGSTRPIRVRAGVSPGSVAIGEHAIYRGQVIFRSGPTLRWLAPEPHPDLTWGTPRPMLTRGSGDPAWDTLTVDVPLQAFALGAVSIPGLRYEDPAQPGERRLPQVMLLVKTVLAASDSNAELRPARGPLAAPWWEQVPWRIVALVALVLSAAIALIRWLRARRRQPATVPVTAVLDPTARALAELEALRALRLPEQGLFAAHAFQLTQILRRYLEAATHVPRPGHTTPELVAVLGRTRLGPDDIQQLGMLLRVWDRLKFARAECSLAESARFEEAVEALVRHTTAPHGKAA